METSPGVRKSERMVLIQAVSLYAKQLSARERSQYDSDTGLKWNDWLSAPLECQFLSKLIRIPVWIASD